MSVSDVLFEGSPTPVLRLSRDGKVIALNSAARRVFGIQPDRILDRPVLGMVVPEDRGRIRDLFLRVLQGQRREWTTRFRRGDAATRVQRVRAVPQLEGGRVESIVMFTTDVPASKDGRPEGAQLQVLLENLPGQFTVSLDGQGRIRSSTGMARTHFRRAEDLIGEHYSSLFDPEEDVEIVQEMIEVVEGGDHWTGLLRHERADGVQFPARTFASPFVDQTNGRVLGTLVVGRDVGVEYKWRERTLRAERFAALGELAASIADEFDEGLRRLEEEIVPANGAGSEIDRLHAFSTSIHEFADNSEEGIGPVALGELTRILVADMSETLAERSVSVEVRAPETLPNVSADAVQIRRVLELLFDNALDSLAEVGGGWIDVELEAEPAGVVLRVTDSGPVPPEDTLHRAFEPFFSTREGRPGLGLSLARALVKANDGRIWSDLDDADHVVFAVYLPVGGAEPSGRFRPVPLVLSHSRSILVVDDEESIRLSMRRFLEKVGFEVREAWSGRSALAQITGGQRPELVLTDLRMRDGSGFWFLEELERDFPDMLGKTVILTGDPEHEGVRRLAAQTGCPVVGKPVEMPELLEYLDEVTRRD